MSISGSTNNASFMPPVIFSRRRSKDNVGGRGGISVDTARCHRNAVSCAWAAGKEGVTIEEKMNRPFLTLSREVNLI